MADIFETDRIRTTSDGDLFINLKCGFGQPSATVIHLIKDGRNEILSFVHDTEGRKIGSILSLKYKKIEIHNTEKDPTVSVYGG